MIRALSFYPSIPEFIQTFKNSFVVQLLHIQQKHQLTWRTDVFNPQERRQKYHFSKPITNTRSTRSSTYNHQHSSHKPNYNHRNHNFLIVHRQQPQKRDAEDSKHIVTRSQTAEHTLKHDGMPSLVRNNRMRMKGKSWDLSETIFRDVFAPRKCGWPGSVESCWTPW